MGQYDKNQSYTDISRIGPIPVRARSESARRFDNRKEKSREMSVVCWSWKWRDADQTECWKTLKMCRIHLLKIILDTTICQEWKQMNISEIESPNYEYVELDLLYPEICQQTWTRIPTVRKKMSYQTKGFVWKQMKKLVTWNDESDQTFSLLLVRKEHRDRYPQRPWQYYG